MDDNNDLMIITKAGILIRTSVAELRVMGRNTQGVKLIRLKNEADEISSVTKIEKDPEPEEVEMVEGLEVAEGVVLDAPALEEGPVSEGGESAEADDQVEDSTEV